MEGGLKPRAALASTKAAQVEEARKMQKYTSDAALKDGLNEPPYEFLELIGKGTFGRVYKSKDRITQHLVAVKIIEMDAQDYELAPEQRDDTVKDFQKESSILKQLKDTKAKNVNVLYDAFAFSTQLWLVSEYCPGGSVHTLMKANGTQSMSPWPNGFDERFIIPIARELGIALQYVHAAGIIHRDVKCANILITEDGRVQLCDFGIAGVLHHEHDKRSTIIGTPNWLPKEIIAAMIGMNSHDLKYNSDIDWWSFGATVYEMATGMAPYGHVLPQQILGMGMPRLDEDKYSEGLCDLVAFCLQERPEDRPSGDQIMQHRYLADTSEAYPTNSLVQLLERYAQWEQRGGHRQSLFGAFGAKGPDVEEKEDIDEWNFSTSEAFESRMSRVNFDHLSDSIYDEALSPRTDDSKTPTAPTMPGQEKSRFDQLQEDLAIQRGERALNKIFNLEGGEYKYGEIPETGRRMSDLPLRNLETNVAGDRTTVIDLDMVDFAAPSINLEQATLKPNRRTQWYGPIEEPDEPDYPPYEDENELTKRATRDWKMPLMAAPVDNSNRRTQDWKFPAMDNRRTQDWTFPKMDTMADSSADESSNGGSLRKRRRPAASQLKLPPLDAANNPNRRTQDWKFPSMEPADDWSVAPDNFRRPSLERAATQPVGRYDDPYDYPETSSPNRESMIDLDMALDVPSDYGRTYTASSAAGSTFTDGSTGNPFDLEDQMELSKNTNRTSMHMKSQSEPAAQRFSQSEERDYGSDSDHGLTADHRVGVPRASSARDLNGHYNRFAPSGLQRKWAAHRTELSVDSSSQFPSFDGDSSAAESAASSPTTNAFEGFDSQTSFVVTDDLDNSHTRNLSFMLDQIRSPPLPPDPRVLSNEADEDLLVAELQRLATDFTRTIDVFAFKYGGEGQAKKD